MSDEKPSNDVAVQSCLDILHSTNPSDSEKNLNGFKSLLLSSSQEKKILTQKVHTLPFHIQNDPKANDRPFILSTYNCVNTNDNEGQDTGNSIPYYRSPWTNNYYPSSATTTKVQQGRHPTTNYHDDDSMRRQLELQANEVWDVYKSMYYGKEVATGSVYIWDDGRKNLSSILDCWSGAFLIHKSIDDGDAEWNSQHIVHVSTKSSGGATATVTYHLQSTVTIHLCLKESEAGNDSAATYNTTTTDSSKTQISGSTEKVTTQTKSVLQNHHSSSSRVSEHLETIGSMIEDVEIDMRSNMDILGIQKTKQVVEQLHPPLDMAEHYAYRPSTGARPGRRRPGPPVGGIPMMGMASGGRGFALPGMTAGGRGRAGSRQHGSVAQQQQDEHAMALQQAVLAQAMKKKSSIS